MAEPGFVFDQEVGVFLATCRTAALGTCGEDGEGGVPHVANVQYAAAPDSGGFGLLWVSKPEALHSAQLTANPRVALAVYAHIDDAANIHGVQMRGTAEVIPAGGAAWHAAWEAYTAKFSFVASGPQYREAVEAQAFYRFTPEWVRWIDNRRGFGWKVEKTLG
ncbi:MAG: pyridoxamine 5'-phosphate oxidase family protein [Planctomycetota bacterium]